MRKVQTWLGSLLLLFFVPLSAKPVMEITIPTPSLHLNPAASSTISFAVKNVSGITLPDLIIPTPQVANTIFFATVASTTCTDSLANQASCEVVLNVAGLKDGEATLSPEVCAFGGAACSHGSVNVEVNQATQHPPITSLAATLPANVEVGVGYPIVATFQNPNSHYYMTGVGITQNPIHSIKTADTCQGGILAPLATCQVSYLFTAPTAGSYHLSGTFSYNEGPDIINQKTVLATQAAVDGTVVTPLPANIEQDRRYPVAFQYTNFSTAALTYQTPVNPPAALTDVVNTCSSGNLASHASCSITGYYMAGSPGSKTLAMTFIPTGPGTLNPVPLSTTSTSTDVAITGIISPQLPITLTPGVSYSVVFTFTNPNTTLAAKAVTIEKLLPNFTQTSDTCSSSSTLAPGASCAIGGDFQTNNEGPVALSVIFDHDDNAAVPLTTSSVATQAALVGTVVGFPANVETSVPHTVTFTFANHGSASATINHTILVFPHSTGPITNHCTNSLVLAPGQNCTITGTLQNAPNGAVNWSATVNYTGGFANTPINVTENTTTNVGDTVVTGDVTTPLPTTVQLNTNYSFQFTFTNNATSTTDATNVHVVKATPHVTNLMDDCPATLAPNTSCTVSGTFNTSHGGPFTLQAVFSYDQGSSVTLTSPTQAVTFLYNYSFLANYISGSTVTSPITGTPNMTLFNTPATAQLGPTGANDAIAFNGINQYAQASNTPLTQIGGPTTFDFWIKWDSFAQRWSRVIDFSNGNKNDNIIITHVATTSALVFQILNGATITDKIRINNFWDTGVWAHVIITIDRSGNINIYKDDQLINLLSPPFPMTVADNIQGTAIVTKTRTQNYVGRSAWSVDGYIDASIANLRIMQGIYPPV